MSTLRVMTYNVLAGGAGREALLRAVVDEINPDLAVFTEITRDSALESIAGAIGPYRAAAGGRRAREFVVIVSRWPIVRSSLYGPGPGARKWVEVTVRPYGESEVTVHGVHLMPQPFWLFELARCWEVRSLVKRLRGRHGSQIVAGDFNALTRGDRQRRAGAPIWVKAQWLLQGGLTPRWALSRLSDAGLVDCYRRLNPDLDGFTIPARDPSARIDYIFASRSLEPALRSAGTTEANGPPASDHLPVWVDFDWVEDPSAARRERL